MQVSRDAIDSAGRVRCAIELVQIEFEYEGEPALRFWLGPTTAQRLGFTSRTVLPLPDFYPPWVDETEWWAVCVKCFAETRR